MTVHTKISNKVSREVTVCRGTKLIWLPWFAFVSFDNNICVNWTVPPGGRKGRDFEIGFELLALPPDLISRKLESRERERERERRM
jgi:hypothetical protein